MGGSAGACHQQTNISENEAARDVLGLWSGGEPEGKMPHASDAEASHEPHGSIRKWLAASLDHATRCAGVLCLRRCGHRPKLIWLKSPKTYAESWPGFRASLLSAVDAAQKASEDGNAGASRQASRLSGKRKSPCRWVSQQFDSTPQTWLSGDMPTTKSRQRSTGQVIRWRGNGVIKAWA
ncbi:hypothetical protein FQR65_LT20278 [Abscondita terminalis]|nr:hypothetical protein FQR65_LT20278 [Abscondita terminalis]